MKTALCMIIAMVTLAGCARLAPVQQTQDAGYILSGQNSAGGFANNRLTLFDVKNLSALGQVALPHSQAKNLSRDPDGNVWIGFSGDLGKSDQRVQIHAANGALIKTLQACTDPEAGISFAAGRAFIACAESGFSGQVVVVNLQTLEIEKTLELGLPDAPWLLIASAASQEAVVVAGLTSGPEETSYGVITVIDPNTLAMQPPILLGKNTDIWRILPHAGKFYLLNNGSYRQPREQANDVLVLTSGATPAIEPLATAPSPLWGAIADDALYAYHNPAWNSTITDPRRQLSRLDLSSGQVQTWDLPNEWDASDLAILNGQIILVKWEYWSGDGNDGLYRFNPDSGGLTLRLNVPDASRVLIP